jgi:hypothetical protein
VIDSIDKIDHNDIIDMSNKNLKTLTVFCLNDKVLFCQSKQASFFLRKSVPKIIDCLKAGIT